MGCPRCRSTLRDPLTSNQWLCRGTVVVDNWVEEPNENGPRAANGQPLTRWMVARPYSEPCLTDYYEETAEGLTTPLCVVCGTHYSIGVCSDCREPVCGYTVCSIKRNDARMCRPHADAYDARLQELAREEARKEADQERAQALAQKADEDRRNEEHDRFVAQRRSTPDGQAALVEEQRLKRRIARVESRNIPSPPWPFALWLVTLTSTFFIAQAIAGSEDAIPAGWVVLSYVVETALIVWWCYAAAEGPDTSVLRRRLSAVQRRRSCGRPSCKRCYP